VSGKSRGLLLTLLASVACLTLTSSAQAFSPTTLAILKDATDGRIDGHWSGWSMTLAIEACHRSPFLQAKYGYAFAVLSDRVSGQDEWIRAIWSDARDGRLDKNWDPRAVRLSLELARSWMHPKHPAIIVSVLRDYLASRSGDWQLAQTGAPLAWLYPIGLGLLAVGLGLRRGVPILSQCALSGRPTPHLTSSSTRQ
jgi:hypothetical protein